MASLFLSRTQRLRKEVQRVHCKTLPGNRLCRFGWSLSMAHPLSSARCAPALPSGQAGGNESKQQDQEVVTGRVSYMRGWSAVQTCRSPGEPAEGELWAQASASRVLGADRQRAGESPAAAECSSGYKGQLVGSVRRRLYPPARLTLYPEALNFAITFSQWSPWISMIPPLTVPPEPQNFFSC